MQQPRVSFPQHLAFMIRFSSPPAGTLRVLVVLALSLSVALSTQAQELRQQVVAFRLAAGVSSQDFSLRIALPGSSGAALRDAEFGRSTEAAFTSGRLSVDAAPEPTAFVASLPAGVNVTVLGSAVGFAARRPELVVNVHVERNDAEADLYLSGRFDYALTALPLAARTGPEEPTTSVLSSGKLVKLAVDEDGVYVIDAALLKEVGLSQTGGPAAVRLYSKGGAMLPERVGDAYPTDLQEVALYEQGNGDSNWDSGERLLFFGQGEDVWSWNAAEQGFDRTENLYAEETYYFIKVEGTGLRMQTQPRQDADNYDSDYTFRARWEEDKVNLLKYTA